MTQMSDVTGLKKGWMIIGCTVVAMLVLNERGEKRKHNA